MNEVLNLQKMSYEEFKTGQPGLEKTPVITTTRTLTPTTGLWSTISNNCW